MNLLYFTLYLWFCHRSVCSLYGNQGNVLPSG